jgi:hypothetical protein
MFGGNSEVCYCPLIGRPYYISTHTAVELSQQESNDRTFVKLLRNVARLTGLSHEFVEQLIKLLQSFPFFWRVESRNDINKKLKIMSYCPGKKNVKKLV